MSGHRAPTTTSSLLDLRVIAGTAVLCLAGVIWFAVHLAAVSSGSFTSTMDASGRTLTSAAPTLSPLGCSLTVDTYCTQRALAARLCDVQITGDPEVIGQGMQWAGSALVESIPQRDGSQVFTCENSSVDRARSMHFTEQEWALLRAPGPDTPQVDAILQG